eukprot:365263-Prorocentrum_lima.AAC.1
MLTPTWWQPLMWIPNKTRRSGYIKKTKAEPGRGSWQLPQYKCCTIAHNEIKDPQHSGDET